VLPESIALRWWAPIDLGQDAPLNGPFREENRVPNPQRRGHLHHEAAEARAAALEWQAAIEGLMLVVDLGGPTMFARIGVLRALNRHRKPVVGPRKKRTKKYRIVR